MYSNNEIRRKAERLVSLLDSYGWKGGEVAPSSLQRSLTLGEPAIFMDIMKYLICHFWDYYGVQILGMYKISLCRDDRSSHNPEEKGGLTEVDHDARSSTCHSVDSVLGEQYPHTLRFRRVSRFVREVLGIHKVYVLESQFARKGFANRKLDMVLDIADTMQRGQHERKSEKKQKYRSSLSESDAQHTRGEYLHPRDKSPPCLLRIANPFDISNLEAYSNELETLWKEDVLPEPCIEDIDSIHLSSVDGNWHIGTSVLEQHDSGIPQTTTNPLFWTSPEDMCDNAHISEYESDTERPELSAHDTDRPCSLLTSLECRVQEALCVFQELSVC